MEKCPVNSTQVSKAPFDLCVFLSSYNATLDECSASCVQRNADVISVVGVETLRTAVNSFHRDSKHRKVRSRFLVFEIKLTLKMKVQVVLSVTPLIKLSHI